MGVAAKEAKAAAEHVGGVVGVTYSTKCFIMDDNSDRGRRRWAGGHSKLCVMKIASLRRDDVFHRPRLRLGGKWAAGHNNSYETKNVRGCGRGGGRKWRVI